MASGVTQLADVVVPEIFSPYVQQITQEKSRLIQSAAISRDAVLDADLAGGGLTFNEPSFKDVDTSDAENVSSDDPNASSTPNKVGTATEVQVRLSRNQSWSSMDLTGDLAGADPMQAIASRVGNYWTQRLQRAFIATMKGVFANNAAATDAYHTQNDMTHDVSGSSYSAGVTDFSAEAFIDTTLTMGDSMDGLAMIMVNSIVYGRMQKNNLIDFIPDSEGRITIPTFLGRTVIVDDGVPTPSSGVFESWLFGASAIRLGMGLPKVPTEVLRVPGAGNGGGQTLLWNRTEWAIHPVGCAYVGSTSGGGPTNAATSNNLAAAGSWRRVFPERKQVRIARLLTREF